MEEMHRARNGVGACGASMPSLGVPPTWHVNVFTNLKHSKPIQLGFLWRLHYIGGIK